jgi:hypothetical protein
LRVCYEEKSMISAKTAIAGLVALTALLPAFKVWCAEPRECVQLSLSAPEGAKFTNVCNEMMNVMYCVDNPQSPKTCSAQRMGITTLVPLSSEIVPDYVATGKGAIYSAICVYPTAPVGWTPGPDNPFTCKKTCVMC